MSLEATVGGEGGADLEHGDLLVRFAEAMTRGNEDMHNAREALRQAIGDDGVIEASGIVGVFNGLDRTADLSGIPLDEGTLNVSADFREELGLNEFVGAQSTNVHAGVHDKAPDNFFDFHASK